MNALFLISKFCINTQLYNNLLRFILVFGLIFLNLITGCDTRTDGEIWLSNNIDC